MDFSLIGLILCEPSRRHSFFSSAQPHATQHRDVFLAFFAAGENNDGQPREEKHCHLMPCVASWININLPWTSQQLQPCIDKLQQSLKQCLSAWMSKLWKICICKATHLCEPTCRMQTNACMSAKDFKHLHYIIYPRVPLKHSYMHLYARPVLKHVRMYVPHVFSRLFCWPSDSSICCFVMIQPSKALAYLHAPNFSYSLINFLILGQ